MLLARVFTRPVKRLLVGVRQVAAGDLGRPGADCGRRDEFADLAAAFNDMSRSLATKQELLDAADGRERPDAARPDARRRWPSATAAASRTSSRSTRTCPSSTPTLDGFDDSPARLDAGRVPRPAQRASSASFDDRRRAARASSGCARCAPATRQLRAGRAPGRPRHPHPRLRPRDGGDVERFNAQHGAEPGAARRHRHRPGHQRAGRAVSAVYDMWGDSVNLAYRVQSGRPSPASTSPSTSTTRCATPCPSRPRAPVADQGRPSNRSGDLRGAVGR